jgi:hypothetical protein
VVLLLAILTSCTEYCAGMLMTGGASYTAYSFDMDERRASVKLTLGLDDVPRSLKPGYVQIQYDNLMKGDPALQTELEREYLSGKRPKTRACVVRAAKKKKKG